MERNEIIEMLKVLQENSLHTTTKGRASTKIVDVKQDSFIWVLQEAIEMLEEDEND